MEWFNENIGLLAFIAVVIVAVVLVAMVALGAWLF